MDTNIIMIICEVISFIPAIVLHEFSHGLAAYKLGDPTAKAQGRLTLNPLAHVDIFGTVILPVCLLAMGGPVFGYAKPVPYNPSYFKDIRKGDFIVGMAGPCANLVLGLIGCALTWAFSGVAESLAYTNDFFLYFYYWFLPIFILINFYLMFFNLLPIPPLDGSSIIALFVPVKHLPKWYAIQRYALPIFMIIVIVVPYVTNVSPISWYLNATAGNLASLLTPYGLL